MAVFKMAQWDFNKPRWCRFSACGPYRLAAGEGEEDYHYHDCDEYIIVTQGRARLLLEGREYEVESGHCVCIPQGGKHRILEALEDLSLLWIYDELKGEGRSGHIPATGGETEVHGAKVVTLGTWVGQKPPWSRLTDLGVLCVCDGKVEMDYHYHDCQEYYFLVKGSLSIVVEGKELRMEEGDVSPIRIGDNHRVVEASGQAVLIWVMDELERQHRYGHLHYEEEKTLPISHLPCRPAPPGTADYAIGIIGVGRIANDRQIPSYLGAGLKVAAICDTNQERLQATSKRFGIEKAFTDYDDLVKLEEVKIVDILTQSWVRPQIVKNAIRAGKHVICEKPFARSMEEAQSMVEAAVEGRVKIAVHQPTGWYYPFALAKILVQRGYVGEPFFFIDDRCHHLDTTYYEWPVTRWHIHLEDFIPMEWGAHPFDIARWLFEMEPARVYWSGTHMPYQNFKSEMAGACVADFPDPLRAVFVLHMAEQSDEHYWHFRIEGKEGTIKGNIDSSGKAPGLECYSKKSGNKWQQIEWSYRESVEEAHGGPMFELINAISEGREPSNSGRDNLNTVRFCLAVLRSQREGRPVSLGL
jgi:predicted dehydrogenase/mannose-6-phosphate isomerase-like protein (cupin superfamily)